MQTTVVNEDIEPVLDSFIQDMNVLYGSQLDSIILYGSYARGDYDEDSDIDLLLLLEKDKVDPYEEIPKITAVAHPLLVQYNQLLAYLPMSVKRWKSEQSFF